MILGLDTSTECLHLALVRGEQSWTRRESLPKGHGHSERLLPALDELLAEADANAKELTGVACCVGPGGFTSLRIGVATAEGLALTGLPTWGFSAFELRAAALRSAGHAGRIWILLDGQRNEAFTQPWEAHATDPARKLPIATLPDLIGDEPWWAPETFLPKLAALDADARVSFDEDAATRAGLATLTRACASREPEAPLQPFYLRETDAELNFPDASAHLEDAHRKGMAR
ncbi:MAG TPA: tRNA (adenosine(37)-N6)-threonylcarbamoyltransferase complex dimerization subunit type 1 TsaB [Holophagaceae bacterium]|jgi:tRNA threonylcarbamoyladenosine biosynthesis protein TsaB|nr:tRNA (adenosine(37)-N6)-threonylcarbamoyltransferase complex dimerization subunit type 1 TsaB [Holophagaceae bacterium]